MFFEITLTVEHFDVFSEIQVVISCYLDYRTELVSWITIELIFKIILLRFLFRKIIIWNFLGFYSKELILNHFELIFVSCLCSS